jgi:transposase-like protein
LLGQAGRIGVYVQSTSPPIAVPGGFKREALELVRSRGRPFAQIARELGVLTESLRLCRKQVEIVAGEREQLSSEEREEPRRSSARASTPR